MSRCGAAVGLIVVAAVSAACGSGGTEGPDRADALASLVDTRVAQRFDLLADDAVVLVEQATRWCGDHTAGVDTDESAETTIDAAVTVRRGWARLAPFGFGPAAERRSRLLVDFPVGVDGVVETLAGDQPVDSTAQRELGAADERGLGVVFALVGPEVAPGVDAVRTCDYVVGAADLVAEEVRGVAAEWATFGPTVTTDDDRVDDTLQDLVSEAAFSLAGIDPEVESAGTSAARISGVRDVFFPTVDGDGSIEGGLGDLLDDDTVERLRAALDAAESDPTAENAMAVEVIVRTDVVSELSLSLNFSDADGDG